MSPEAVSPLRQPMTEDMTIRQFGEHTKRNTIRQVPEFNGLPRGDRPSEVRFEAAASCPASSMPPVVTSFRSPLGRGR